MMNSSGSFLSIVNLRILGEIKGKWARSNKKQFCKTIKPDCQKVERMGSFCNDGGMVETNVINEWCRLIFFLKVQLHI